MTTSFSASVLKLLRGSLAGQLLAFLALPVLSRLYAPQDFGVAQAMIAILTLVLIASSLRLEVALLSVQEVAFEDLLRSAWWLCVATTLAVLLLVTLLSYWRNDWPASQRLMLWTLPFISLFAGWNQLLNYVSLRRQRFEVASNVKIVQAAGYTSSAISFGAIKPSSVALLSAEAIGRGAACAFMARSLRLGRQHFAWPGFRALRLTLAANRELVTVGLSAALLNAVGSSFISAVILWVFSAADAGQYAMVERTVGMPVALLVGTLSQVFMAKLAAALAAGDAAAPRKAFHRLVAIQAATGLPLFAMLYLVGPDLLTFLLGSNWKPIANFVQPMALLYLLAYVAGPVNMTLTMVGEHKFQLAWDSLRLLAVGVAWLCIWQFGLLMRQALWVHCAVSAGCYLIYLAMAESKLREQGSPTRGAAI
jgi:O-antigen/teichoic acid export membrane protein